MKPVDKSNKEARLAEALRANLRRRKGAEPKMPMPVQITGSEKSKPQP